MKLDQLLEFCAYYHINNNLATLPLKLPLAQNQQQLTNQNLPLNKQKKKKVETIPTTKVQKRIKAKVQITSKKKNNNDQSPFNVQSHQNNLDLNFFINHVSGSNPRNQYKDINNQRNYTHNTNYQETIANNLNKYSTFGRNETFNLDYQNHQKKKNNYEDNYMSFTSKIPKNNEYESNFRPYQNYGVTGSQITNFQNIPYQNIKYPFKYDQIQYATKKSKINSGLYSQSKLTQRNPNPFQILSMYSPIRRENQYNQYSPSHSAIGFNITNSALSDRSLSKSRKKHKRKNSQRPFYDASSSKLKDSKQRQSDNKIINQSIIQNSFTSISQISKINPYPTKRNSNNEAKRQTTTTNSNKMKQYSHKRQASDLDDQMHETITYVANEQRNAPIAINLQRQYV